MLDLAAQQVIYLAVVSKNPLGTAKNPNVNVGAENLKYAQGAVKTPSDYLKLTQQQLSSTQFDYTFGDISTTTQSGGDFAIMTMQMNYQGVDTYQTQVCTLRKGYAILFTFTYYSEDEMNEMSDISDTIALN